MSARLGQHSMMPTYYLVPENMEGERGLSGIDSVRQLPQISIDDPAIISLRAENGMTKEEIDGRVVKFLRRSLKAGVAPFYRVIVDTPIGRDGINGWSL